MVPTGTEGGGELFTLRGISRGKMDAGEFLIGAEATRVIARAAKVARTAVSIHTYDAGHESDKTAGCGPCAEACAFVHTLSWGPQACRRSREKNSRTALKRGRPVPYLCHLGFACVAVPALTGTDEDYVVTFGPYCPAETPDALERDALEGLRKLEQSERKELPFSLGDIPRVPAEAVPEVAEWLNETLAERMSVLNEEKDLSRDTKTAENNDDGTSLKHNQLTAVHEEISLENPPKRIKRGARVDRDAFGAHAILAAMASPDAAAFRGAIENQVTAGLALRRPEQIRARVSAVVSAVTEVARGFKAAGAAGSPLDELSAALAKVQTVKQGVGAAVHALAPLRRELLRAEAWSSAFYTEIERYVEERLTDALSLDAAAKHFGLPPSTLTRRLERRYGQTFTGYVARRRVERAKTMLAKSKLSVDVVARRVGLTDGAHLRKLLRRFEGSTPSVLRARKVR